ANGKLAKNLSGRRSAIRSLKFSGDNTRLVAASADKRLRVWTVPAGKRLAQVLTDSEINAVTWLTPNDELASAGADNLIRIWRLDPGNPELTPVKLLQGHERPVTALDSIPSETPQIISGSEDGSLRLWNAGSG